MNLLEKIIPGRETIGQVSRKKYEGSELHMNVGGGGVSYMTIGVRAIFCQGGR